MDLNIRKLRPADLPLLQYAGRATYEPYYPHLWKPGGQDWYMEHCFGTEILERELLDANIDYLLAYTAAGSNELVGLLKLILEKPVPGGLCANALYLEKIYLMPDFFGRGIGQELLEYVLERARALGREAVWLQVMKTGPRQVYEKAGFETVGEAPIDFDLMKEEERGLWVMWRQCSGAIFL
jgi:ribosomal protein S18 acetylase RimI-like enzyme